MSRTINILVSGVGGDVGQGVIKALEKGDLDLKIFKICAYLNSSWLFKDELSYIAPFAASEDYIPFLIKLINKLGIDVFIPCIDSETYKVACNKKFIEECTGALVCVDSIQATKICNDKLETSIFLSSNGFHGPKTILPLTVDEINQFVEKVGFPIIAKRRIGQGAKDITIVNSHADAINFEGNSDFILQEFLHSDGEEFTTGVYLGDDGEVKGICTLKRELKNGSTYRAERIIDDALESPIRDIAKKIGMKYINIQSRERNGILYPFEFNGRFSGTTGIISRIFNAPEMYIREKVLQESLSEVKNTEKFFVMRYYEEIYASQAEVAGLSARSKQI